MCGVGEKSETGGHAHLAGVCGTGMAGLALLLSKSGWRVSGCDLRPNSLRGWLEEAGVTVAEGHASGHLEGVDRLIVSAAVDRDEPELAAARVKGIPVQRRGEVLAALVSQSRSVAVCGTHGKTTTSCFTARLFQELGTEPGWCIGGSTPSLGGVAGGGTGLLVVEADESDGTLALYCPAITVLTNIDLDHMEHFSDEAALKSCFRQVLSQTREGVAFCRDDERAWQVVSGMGVSALGYGFSVEAGLRAIDVETVADSVAFGVVYKGHVCGRVELGVAGRHNVLNALGAAAAALLAGHAPDRVFNALGSACGELPGRRFERVATVDGIRF
ncbi:MAG: Mur ligase domain-containing protein, partial [Kiritimatiellae bacterium]|nr:Mur ligase domain-containing protein [Kiritimatiellia bacterium]